MQNVSLMNYCIPFLVDEIKMNTSDKNFFYIFTGDTQYWWACDATNVYCKEVVKWCTDLYPATSRSCEVAAGEYTNKAQFTSIARLAKEISAFHPRGVEGLIINGDLTAYGHTDELYYFRAMWRKYSTTDAWSFGKVSAELDQSYVNNIKEIYLGLGNHDYANNVDDCYMNNCAINMVDYMLQSFPNESTVDISNASHITHTYQSITYEATERHGSLAYSWKTCLPNYKCFLFFQLHNYPTYTRFINTWNEQYNITDSLSFVRSELIANPGLGVVINFHDYDDAFSSEDKQKFKQILTGPFNIYGIFIAHMHSEIGLREYICINRRTVPVIYSGSVPANNYLLAKFFGDSLDPTTNPPVFYKVNVQDINGNSEMVKLENINYKPC